MPGVPLDPVEGYAVTLTGGVETEPEVHVLLPFEPFPFPAFQPAFVDGLDDVGGIADHVHLRVVPPDLFQADDDRQQFHPVVGGAGEAA